MRIWSLVSIVIFAVAMPQVAETQIVPAVPAMSYADLADLALAAPMTAHVQVNKADRLSAREAPDVAPGYHRFLIEADVTALIRGPVGTLSRIRYLVDLPSDERGRPPRIRRRDEFVIFASPVPSRPGEVRLITRDSQIAVNPQVGGQVRAILSEAARADSPPPIVGIGRAFHVPGSLAGESETQIFLQTANDQPISLSVLRRPGEQPRWSVALSEIVDAAAAPPERETLLWYRLACTLPPVLPSLSLREAGPAEARAIEADYRLVLQRLGPCVRNRPQA